MAEEAPAVQRLQDIRDDLKQMHQEVKDIENGNRCGTVETDHGTFNNMKWVICEVESLKLEKENLIRVMDKDGDVSYND